MSDFFAMGGYAAYVWPAYGFALLILIGLFLHSRHAVRRQEAELEQLKLTARGPAAGGVSRPVLRPAEPSVPTAQRNLGGQTS